MTDGTQGGRPEFTLVTMPAGASAADAPAPMFSAPVQDGTRRKGDIFRPGPGPMVEFRGVVKTYDGDSRGLSGVSLQVGTGEFVFLVGPSGSGKSTLIRLIIRELRPTSGTVIVGAATSAGSAAARCHISDARSAAYSRTSGSFRTARRPRTWHTPFR